MKRIAIAWVIGCGMACTAFGVDGAAGSAEPYFKDAYKSADAYRPGGRHTGYPVEQAVPPGPSIYKLTKSDKRKLTPADVLGPDGIVYPNWRNVGIPGGIPKVPVVIRLDDLGARPQTDISALLAQALDQAAAKGGGAILIGEGTYHLDKPVIIRQSGVVIRGAGKDKTRLIFRYGLDDSGAKLPGGWPEPGAFVFQGGNIEASLFLAEDGKRGDTSLVLKEIGNLKIGDAFVLRADCNERWQKLLRTTHRGVWGSRTCQYQVESIKGNTLGIGEALRIDYPVVDKAEVRRVTPVRRSGLEDFTLEHACRMQFHSVSAQWAWECWVRGVDVIDSGKGGAHLSASKRCEIRDCEFTGFDPKIHRPHQNWWGYAGFTQSQDCLMDNTVWRRFRHGPQVQFGAQGNVIRNSVFDGSDAQWHAGWAAENLFENCVVTHGNHGSYGYGCYATGSGDSTHGPNGPRNVVYNCRFTSPKDGAFIRGVNENWIFAYNLFDVGDGAGYRAEGGSYDAILRGNTFVLRNSRWPMLMLTTRDCTGTEVIGNTLHGGNGTLVVTEAPLAVDKDNRALPLEKFVMPQQVKANPVSIFEWQIKTRSP